MPVTVEMIGIVAWESSSLPILEAIPWWFVVADVLHEGRLARTSLTVDPVQPVGAFQPWPEASLHRLVAVLKAASSYTPWSCSAMSALQKSTL